MSQFNLFTTIAEVSPIFQPTQAAQRKITEPKNREDLQNLIYQNGGNRPATIVMHEDDGHGWLQVPHSIIKMLKIGPKNSGFSFQDANFVYLEEDLDLSTCLNALGIAAGSELNKMFFQEVAREYKEESPIRRKNRYGVKY